MCFVHGIDCSSFLYESKYFYFYKQQGILCSYRTVDWLFVTCCYAFVKKGITLLNSCQENFVQVINDVIFVFPNKEQLFVQKYLFQKPIHNSPKSIICVSDVNSSKEWQYRIELFLYVYISIGYNLSRDFHLALTVLCLNSQCWNANANYFEIKLPLTKVEQI